MHYNEISALFTPLKLEFSLSSNPHAIVQKPPPPPSARPPTASSSLVDCSCATCRGMRRWSSPARQGEESVDTSADVSERRAGFCGWRITATVWSQLDEVCIPILELAFRDVRMQGSLVCSPEQARQILEAVVEHHVSVASNPSMDWRKFCS